MNIEKTFIRERKFKAGYIVREERYKLKGVTDKIFKTAYNFNGDYIGNQEEAYFLCVKKGILPELRAKTHNTCSIGFSRKDGMWYGWSHRGICGFKIGSKVSRGDCAYSPANKKDFLEECLNFWHDRKYHKEIKGYFVKNKEKRNSMYNLFWRPNGVKILYKYNNKVPNKKLHHKIENHYCDFPDKWGRGEWIAKTLEDARQMACDYAESLS